MPGLSRKPSKCSYLGQGRSDALLSLFSRKAALTAHPDKGGSEAKMAVVNEAYEVLSKPGSFSPLSAFSNQYQPCVSPQNCVNDSTTATTRMILWRSRVDIRSLVDLEANIHLRSSSSRAVRVVGGSSSISATEDIGVDMIEVRKYTYISLQVSLEIVVFVFYQFLLRIPGHSDR